MSANIVALLGNLTRDPEIRFTPKGEAVCEFGIAVNERWRGVDGQEKESKYFGECMCWGKRGEALGEHFRKGDMIFVQGKLALEEWEDKKTGDKRNKTRIKVEQWSFCGARKSEGQSREDQEQETAQRQQTRDYNLNRGQPRTNARPTQQRSAADQYADKATGGGADSGEIPFAPFNEPCP